jgi:hypothetical protein
MAIMEELFNAARDCVARGSVQSAKQKLGLMRQRAVAVGLKPEQIQTIEVAAIRAAKLQAAFGKKRGR